MGDGRRRQGGGRQTLTAAGPADVFVPTLRAGAPPSRAPLARLGLQEARSQSHSLKAAARMSHPMQSKPLHVSTRHAHHVRKLRETVPGSAGRFYKNRHIARCVRGPAAAVSATRFCPTARPPLEIGRLAERSAQSHAAEHRINAINELGAIAMQSPAGHVLRARLHTVSQNRAWYVDCAAGRRRTNRSADTAWNDSAPQSVLTGRPRRQPLAVVCTNRMSDRSVAGSCCDRRAAILQEEGAALEQEIEGQRAHLRELEEQAAARGLRDRPWR
eukprot:SAG11_NODE_4979_length_1704_cov_2.172586_1_plen_273_part_00